MSKRASSSTPKSRSWPQAPEPLPRPVVDNHTHFGMAPDPEITPETRTLADQIERATRVNVDRYVHIGCTVDDARHAVQLAHAHREIVCGVALHPNEAARLASAGVLAEALDVIAELALDDRVRAISETGIDRYWTGPEGMVAQRESFRAHIDLAKATDKPMQIHDRDAHAEVLEVLRSDGAPERTVWHCFSGDAQMARECVARGWFVSFAGTVTFKNAAALRHSLLEVPLSQLLVETDAPYLTPHPFRGKPNAPYLIPVTVRAMADVLDTDLGTLCDSLSANAEALYGPW